jgi:hypothetical protein
MSFQDRYDFDMLSNESERLVIEEVDRKLNEAGEDELLADEDAVIDITALALNMVKPMYRVNLLGRLYAKAVDEEKKEEVREAVKKAIAKIKENPA